MCFFTFLIKRIKDSLRAVYPYPMKDDLSDFFSIIETQLQPGSVENAVSCITLHKCVSQVIDNLQSKIPATSKRINNDVHPEILVSTDKDKLMAILSFLLNTLVINGQHHIIYLSAKLIGSITLIHIRTSDTKYSAAIINSVRRIEPLAEKLGGCVTISSNKMYGLTLAFTFINQ